MTSRAVARAIRFAGGIGLVLMFLLAPAASAETVETLFEGSWTKGGYAIAGGWKIVAEDGRRYVVLDEDFETRRAPDLKLFLSKRPLDELGDRTATRGAVLIAPLERVSGGQRYAIDPDVDLSRYRSLLIHCERYSKYWGGAELEPPDEE